MDRLVHDQDVIKKLLREIGEYKGDCKCHCLKSIDKLLDGGKLLELYFVMTCMYIKVTKQMNMFS